MFVFRHQTADSFLAHAQAVLEQHEAANNLMIGIAVRLHEFPDRIKTPPLPGDGRGWWQTACRRGDDAARTG